MGMERADDNSDIDMKGWQCEGTMGPAVTMIPLMVYVITAALTERKIPVALQLKTLIRSMPITMRSSIIVEVKHK